MVLTTAVLHTRLDQAGGGRCLTPSIDVRVFDRGRSRDTKGEKKFAVVSRKKARKLWVFSFQVAENREQDDGSIAKEREDRTASN